MSPLPQWQYETETLTWLLILGECTDSVCSEVRLNHFYNSQLSNIISLYIHCWTSHFSHYCDLILTINNLRGKGLLGFMFWAMQPMIVGKAWSQDQLLSTAHENTCSHLPGPGNRKGQYSADILLFHLHPSQCLSLSEATILIMAGLPASGNPV